MPLFQVSVLFMLTLWWPRGVLQTALVNKYQKQNTRDGESAVMKTSGRARLVCNSMRKFTQSWTPCFISYSFALSTCPPGLLLTSLCSDTHFFCPYLHSILTPTSCAQVLNPLAVSTSCSLTLGHALSSDGLEDGVVVSWGLHASHHIDSPICLL